MSTPPRYYRRVIKIKAEDSPNVRLALLQESRGLEPKGEQIVPGVLPYDLYVQRRATWDKIRQCVGLDAEFYEGGELLMYPPDWLNRAERIARDLEGINRDRLVAHMGVDPAEGGDKSAWAVIDAKGMRRLHAVRTPDTVQIVNITIGLIREYKIDPRNVFFDRGGGGTQHVDRLREQGFNVQSVGFGEAVSPPPRRLTPGIQTRKEEREDNYAFAKRRSQMYWLVRMLIDPSNYPDGFGIPAEYTELRHQLSPIPLMYDGEGRISLPPKNKRNASDKQPCLVDIIGHSPDEADALALAAFSMTGKPERKRIGVVTL